MLEKHKKKKKIRPKKKEEEKITQYFRSNTRIYNYVK